MKTIDKWNGSGYARRCRRHDKAFGLCRRYRQRLLADDMLSRGNDRQRLLGMQRIRRADMNHVDLIVIEHRIDIVVVPLDAQVARRRSGALRARRDDTDQPGASGPRRPAVHRSHEAATDESHTYRRYGSGDL